MFARWHITGTFSGARWMGPEPNGARIALYGIDCLTLRSGFVVHNFVVYDRVGLGCQIGMMPPEGSAMDRPMTGAFTARTRLIHGDASTPGALPRYDAVVVTGEPRTRRG